jgi:hypothetical protein
MLARGTLIGVLARATDLGCFGRWRRSTEVILGGIRLAAIGGEAGV